MKKAKKAVIAALAAATLTMSALGLAACSKKGDGSTPDGGGNDTYTVTFKVNEGAWNAEGTEVADKTRTTGTDGKVAQADWPTNPSREDYTFAGWYVNAEGTGVSYTFASTFSSDQTLYAKWTSNEVPTTYTVTLDPGDGTLEGGTTVTTGADGKLATLPTPTAPANKTFSGWFTAETGGTQVTTDTVFNNNTTTIYAQYTENGGSSTTYTVTLDPGEGTLTGATTVTTGTDGKIATLPTPTPPANKTFKGWFTAATGGTKVTADTVFNNNTTTIYAQYTENGQVGTTYTVTLNAYGGTLAGEATATTGTDGKLATLPAAPTAPEGGEFKGWYTAATGGTQITTATVFNNNTTTIYARYAMANPPAAAFGSAVIKANETAMTSNTANISRNYVMPESGDPYFENSTKSDEFMLTEQTFDSQTVLHITKDDAPLSFWCEAAEGVRVSEKNSNTNKVTVSAGTYSFYLQKYADGGWTMWVAGSSQSGGGGDEADVDDGLYIVGAHNNWIPTAADKGDGPTALYDQGSTTKYGDEYKFTVTFSASPEAPIMDFKIATYESNAAKLDGWHCKLQNDIPESVATGGGVGNDAPNIKVIEAGSYEVYLKVYVNGGSDIWLGKVVGSKTITLNANGGTLAGAATVTTDQFGKLNDLPAEPTAPTGKRFDGWYTAATGGTKIAAGAMFTANATIYAQYVDASTPAQKADGLYIGDNMVTGGALVINAGGTDASKTQYWLGAGNKVSLTQGQVIDFYIGGVKLDNIYNPSGATAVDPGDYGKCSQVSIDATGNYVIYLNKWSDSGNYGVEFVKDTDIGSETTVPQGTPFTVKGATGPAITIYLKDAEGNDVTNLGDYKIWMWGDGNNYLASDWADRPTVTANVTATKALGSKVSFKFTYGAGSETQSNNFENIETGATYVVSLKDNTIKKLVIAG